GSGDDGGLACEGAHGELLNGSGIGVRDGWGARGRPGRAPPTVRAYRSTSTRRFGRTATRPLGWPGARVAELAAALDLGSSARGREGSSPFSRTHAAAAEAAAAQTTAHGSRSRRAPHDPVRARPPRADGLQPAEPLPGVLGHPAERHRDRAGPRRL